MRVLPVRLLPDVERDFQEIAELLMGNGASQVTVDRYFERIIDRAVAIGSAPLGYPLRESVGPGVRMLQFEHSARIAYRVTDDAVEIIRVFYGRQDLTVSIVPGILSDEEGRS